MKKRVRIISIILMVLMCITCMAGLAYADYTSTLSAISEGTGKVSSPEAAKIGGNVVGLIQLIGTILAVVMLAILGVKYITASPEGKADYKGSMVPYVVGCIILLLAVNLTSVIFTAITNASK